MEIESKKLFIVTFVGLSDDEGINGYCEVKPFFSRKKAEDHMRMLKDNEVEEHKYYDPKVFEGPDRVVIQWCGYQQCIITIHEEEIC